MGKYRDRLEIIADILNAAAGGAKKTKIMYCANLSYKLLEKYLEEAIRIGFMRFNNDCYEVTERGQALLEKYDQFSNKYSRIKIMIQGMMFERESLKRMCEPVSTVEPKSNNRRKSRA
jgi:predicted transcriptional regulator